mgnify:CR=1 FL=1
MRAGLSLIPLALLLATGLALAYADPYAYLKTSNYGRIIHLEIAPKIAYRPDTLTGSGLMEEALIQLWTSGKVDPSLLERLEAYKVEGGWSETPHGPLSLRACWLAHLLFRELGLDDGINRTLIKSLKPLTVREAYYQAMILGDPSPLKRFRSWEGYSLTPGGPPDPWASVLAMEVTGDKRLLDLVEASGGRGALLRAYSLTGDPRALKLLPGEARDWETIYSLHLLGHRLFLVNLTVEPYALAEGAPKLTSLSTSTPLGRPLRARAYFFFNGTHSLIYVEAGGLRRFLAFRHRLLGRLEAYASAESPPGELKLSFVVNGKPPFLVSVRLAGRTYNYTSYSGRFRVVLKHEEVGCHKVLIIIRSADSFAKGYLTVELRQPELGPSWAMALLPLSFLVALAPEMVVYMPSRLRREAVRRAVGAVSILLPLTALMPTLLSAYLWATAFAVLAVAAYTGRKYIRPALEYSAIAGTLLASSLLIGSPLPLVVAGIGNAVWLACLMLFPSEWKPVDRYARAVNAFYAAAVLILQGLVEMARKAAGYLYQPSWGMVQAVTVNAAMIANIIALVPIIAPLYFFLRLYATAQRARAVEDWLNDITE